MVCQFIAAVAPAPFCRPSILRILRLLVKVVLLLAAYDLGLSSALEVQSETWREVLLAWNYLQVKVWCFSVGSGSGIKNYILLPFVISSFPTKSSKLDLACFCRRSRGSRATSGLRTFTGTTGEVWAKGV